MVGRCSSRSWRSCSRSSLHATPLGRSIFAIGADQEAAYFAGIRVKRIKLVAVRALGRCSARFAGILWTRCASPRARYDAGTGLELNVVTIVLLGGISIFGGRGTILGVVLAVCRARCAAGRAHARLISPQDQNIVIGGLLIVSVIVPERLGPSTRARARGCESAAARRPSAAGTRRRGRGSAP